MRILHLLDYSFPKIGGYSIRSHYILKNQKQFADSFALTKPCFIRKNGPYIYDGVIYFRYPPNKMTSLFYDTSFSKRFKISKLYYQFYFKILRSPNNYLSELVKSLNIDIIHGHSPAEFSKFGEMVSNQKNIPFVYEVRGFWEDTAVSLGLISITDREYWKRRENETSLMRKADAISTLGTSMKRELIQRGINEKKIYVIPNAVDINQFTPKPPNEEILEYLRIKNKKIISYIGSIRPLEGIEILLRAIKKLTKKLDSFMLLLIGKSSSQYRIKLEKIIKNLKIEEYVKFLGQIEPEKIAKYYSISDLITIPRINTRVTRYVTPLKPLEAMAMEKVVLASDLPALRELIKPNVSGDLFKAGDPNDLANKIVKYLNNEKIRIELAKRARKYVERQFSWEKVILKYKNLYQDLLN